MVMLAEHYDYVIGGDPDRDTIDLAVVAPAAGASRAPVRYRQWPGLCAHAGLGSRAGARTADLGAGGHRQLRRRAHDGSRRCG